MLVEKVSRFAFCFGLTASLALVGCGGDEPTGDDEVGDTGDTDGDDGEDTTTGTEAGTDDSGTTDAGPTDTDGSTDAGTTEEGTTDEEESSEEETTGDPEPLDPLPESNVGEWVYHEIPGTYCRDGSPAGLVVRYADNDSKLAIFMEGGGACFNGLTCAANPSSINPGSYDPGPFGGVFDNQNPDNPMMDYNFVFIPFCTGDVFMGTTESGDAQGGPQDQMFVGHNNLEIMLDRIVDTWPNAEEVVDTGVSAGGFGAGANYDTVASYFPDVDVVLLDDSGPLFRDEYLAPCLQQQFRDTWEIDGALPQDCEGCFNGDGGGLSNYLVYIQEKYPNAPMGIMSSLEDGVIKLFFGYGANDCNAFFPSFNNFPEALADMRDNVLTYDNSGTYFMNGTGHTSLSGNGFYSTEVNGVVMSDWVTDLMDGVPSDVAP